MTAALPAQAGPSLPELPKLPPLPESDYTLTEQSGVLDKVTAREFPVFTDYAMREYARAAISAHEAEVVRLTKHLQFVERWANHHGQKPRTTPEETLSCIQHYPPILAITRGYEDGKVPETPNPYAEATQLREVLAELLAAQSAEYPSFEEGKEAQDAWSNRRAKAVDDALDLLAVSPANQGETK